MLVCLPSEDEVVIVGSCVVDTCLVRPSGTERATDARLSLTHFELAFMMVNLEVLRSRAKQ